MNTTVRRNTARRFALVAGTVLLAGMGSLAGGLIPASADSSLDVTSTADVADPTPGDATCDTLISSAAAGACTLRAATQTAVNLTGTTTINLPAGHITIAIAKAGADNATTGDFNTESNVIIAGQGVGTTIVDGGGLDRVFATDCIVGTGHTVAFRNMTITGGAAPGLHQGVDYGGGLLTCGTNMTLDHVNLNNNHATSGGAIASNGSLAVTNSTVDTNTATSSSDTGLLGKGGGILAFAVTLTADTLSANTARTGGGLYHSGGPGGNAQHLTNSTFTGNRASAAQGGGIYDEASPLTLTNLTVAANSAKLAGGNLFLAAGSGNGSGPMHVGNTIVGANGDAGVVSCGGIPLTSDGHNIDLGTSCGFTAAGDQAGTDPQLGALADNGGPTRTMAIAPPSPAVDHGSNTLCPTTDQRGLPRPSNGICDVGAFEFQLVPALPASPASPASPPGLPRAGAPAVAQHSMRAGTSWAQPEEITAPGGGTGGGLNALVGGSVIVAAAAAVLGLETRRRRRA